MSSHDDPIHVPLPESRATLRLSFDCDNACVFCGQDGLSGANELSREHLAKLREQSDEITFIGGEPSLDDRLIEAIGLAHERGFRAIGLQTNGRRLAADPPLFAKLIEAGLSDLHLSIHGPNAACHDYHTGRPGSFDAVTDLLEHARRKAGLAVVVTTVVTRSNARELPKLPTVLKRLGVSGWLIEFVRGYGAAADGFASVVPRFGMALPWALLGLEQARRNALSAWIRGAPLCGLGPFAGSALASEPRSYPPPCEGCPAHDRCCGVDPVYVEVFDHSELRPKAVRPPTKHDAGRRQIMRMFVGVGELVERAPRLYTPKTETETKTEAKAGKHRRLPVLGNSSTDQADST